MDKNEKNFEKIIKKILRKNEKKNGREFIFVFFID